MFLLTSDQRQPIFDRTMRDQRPVPTLKQTITVWAALVGFAGPALPAYAATPAPVVAQTAAAGIWDAKVGSTLSRTLAEWGARAGWQVVWRADFDYRIAAPLAYRGEFLDAVSGIVGDFASAQRPLQAEMYRNRVLVISPRR